MPRKPGKPGKSAIPTENGDAALWLRVAAGTRPLDPAKRNRPAAAVPNPAPAPAGDRARPAKPSPRPAAGPAARPPPRSGPAAAAAPVAVGGAARGQAPGLDRRLAERLRRGALPLEGRLDLHGMTRAAGRAALDRFLAEASGAGRRAILVITGKGRRSAPDDHGRPGDGVLRREVPGWLGAGANRGLVLAWAPARPRDGGEGAIYVLLRRRRDG